MAPEIPMLRDVKHRKIILTKEKVLERYLEFLAKNNSSSPDVLLESFKKIYNIELVGMEGELGIP